MLNNIDLEFHIETRTWDEEKGPEKQLRIKIWIGLYVWFAFTWGWNDFYLLYEWKLRNIFRYSADESCRDLQIGRNHWQWTLWNGRDQSIWKRTDPKTGIAIEVRKITLDRIRRVLICWISGHRYVRGQPEMYEPGYCERCGKERP